MDPKRWLNLSSDHKMRMQDFNTRAITACTECAYPSRRTSSALRISSKADCTGNERTRNEPFRVRTKRLEPCAVYTVLYKRK